MRRSLTIIAIVLLCIVPAVPSAGATTDGIATTQDTICTSTDEPIPEGRTGLFDTLRAMNDTAAFGSYNEFEIIRSQAVLDVQTGEFDADDRSRITRAVSLLRTFQRAYACRAAGEFNASLTAANRTAELASGFQDSAGQRVGVLARLGLTRFYADLGDSLLSRGESLERTPDRIEAFEDAALAFKRAGATQRFSRLSVRLDSTRQEYRSDMRRYDNTTTTASSFLEKCTRCDDPVAALSEHRLGVFGTYIDARTARAESGQAVALAQKHALDEREGEAARLRDRTTAAAETLAVASAGLMLGFAFVVGLVGALVAWRLTAWRRDVEDSKRGDIVLVGEMLDA